MIITGLLNVLYNVLNTLLVFTIPQLPEGVTGYINTFTDYVVAGTGILANYAPLGYLLTLVGIMLAVDVGIMLYHFVMWILRKIPMLGIE